MSPASAHFRVHHPVLDTKIPPLRELRERATSRALEILDAAARAASWRVQREMQLQALRDELATAPRNGKPHRIEPVRHEVRPIDLLRALLAVTPDVIGGLLPGANGPLRQAAARWTMQVQGDRVIGDLCLESRWARRWAMADHVFDAPEVTTAYLLASVGYETLRALAPLSSLVEQDLASLHDVHRRFMQAALAYTDHRIFEPLLPAYYDRHGGLSAIDEALASHHGVVLVGPEGSGRTALLEAWLRRMQLGEGTDATRGLDVLCNPFDADWMNDEASMERVVTEKPSLLALTPKGRRVFFDPRDDDTVRDDGVSPARLWDYEPEYASGSPETRLLTRCSEWASEPWRRVYVIVVLTEAERERLVARAPMVADFPAVRVPPLDTRDHLPVWLCHGIDREGLGIDQALAILSELRPADVARVKPWDIGPVLGSSLAQRLYDPERARMLEAPSWLRRAVRRLRRGRTPWPREMFGARARFVERFIGDDERFAALVTLDDRLQGNRAAKLLDARTLPPSKKESLSLSPAPPAATDARTTCSDVLLVYRRQQEGPLGKRVRRLRGENVLEWFQHAWDAATKSGDPQAWVEETCGGPVQGLASIFHAAIDEGIDAPSTWEDLHELMLEHLYVPGGPDNIRQGGRTVRVRTHDDDMEQAYYLFDREFAETHPERCTFLLHESWPLPDDADEQGGFDAGMLVAPLLPGATGNGSTYACLVTYYDASSLSDLRAHVFPGVRLPELGAHLREVSPASIEQRGRGNFVWFDTWPLELRLLRAMVQQDDKDLSSALARCNRYPLEYVGSRVRHTRLGIGAQGDAKAEFDDAAAEARRTGRDPEKTRLVCSPHIAQMCLHASDIYGFQQWFLFDDCWAARHPNLARSLLRYCSGWDPLL